MRSTESWAEDACNTRARRHLMLRAATRAAARPTATRAAARAAASLALALVRRVALVVGTRTSVALALVEARWRRRAALLGGGLVRVRVRVSGQGQGQG